MLFGFAPWLIYWVLVGNVPFKTAVVVALVIAIGAFAVGRALGKSGGTLEIGAVATFAVLTALTFTLSETFMHRWIQPLSSGGIFLVALIGQLVGKSFVREFAAAEQPPDVVKTELFDRITDVLSWIWIAAFAGMTVSSAIPPVLEEFGDRRPPSSTRRPAPIHLLLGHPVLVAGAGGAGVTVCPRADAGRHRRPRAGNLVRRVRRGDDR